MAYEEFGKLLKRLMEGEAFVYITDFFNSSMVKYDKVNILINYIIFDNNIIRFLFDLSKTSLAIV